MARADVDAHLRDASTNRSSKEERIDCPFSGDEDSLFFPAGAHCSPVPSSGKWDAFLESNIGRGNDDGWDQDELPEDPRFVTAMPEKIKARHPSRLWHLLSCSVCGAFADSAGRGTENLMTSFDAGWKEESWKM